MVKDAYRATNHKDEYPQMTLWLGKEKVLRHDKFIKHLKDGLGGIPLSLSLQLSERQTKMTITPSVTVKLADLPQLYGIQFFSAALSRYVAQFNAPNVDHRALEEAAYGVNIDFSKIPVFHRIKFIRHDPIKNETHTVDAIHVQPPRTDRRGDTIPGRFDTALVCLKPQSLALKGQP